MSTARRPAATPPFTRRGWRALEPVARGLMLTRFVRSMAQGALVVDFVLYLKELGWSAAAIGSLVGVAGVVGAVLLLLAGMLSDRFGRRPFLLGYQFAAAVGALAVVLSPRGWVLALVAVVLGYGRGANGSAGPFAPVEQAWLAGSVGSAERGQVFSLNVALGFLGMGVGTLFGAAVPLFARVLPGTAAYQPLFVLNVAAALVTTWMIARLRERPRPARRGAAEPAGALAGGAVRAPAGEPTDDLTDHPTDDSTDDSTDGPTHSRRAAPDQHAGTGADTCAGARSGAPDAAEPAGPSRRRRENVALALLVGVNSVNALGIGLIGPLLPYWFAVRFGAGVGAIASVYAVTFFLAALSSVATGQVGARVGIVRSVVGPRALGVLTLLAMPLMPAYGWAAGLYALRSILNRGTAGARQAFSMGLVGDERRGLAGSLNALSFRLPSAVGAAAAGWLMGAGLLSLPFFLAGAFQLGYVVLFATVLRPYENGT